jgi:hypothetical protein
VLFHSFLLGEMFTLRSRYPIAPPTHVYETHTHGGRFDALRGQPEGRVSPLRSCSDVQRRGGYHAVRAGAAQGRSGAP